MRTRVDPHARWTRQYLRRAGLSPQGTSSPTQRTACRRQAGTRGEVSGVGNIARLFISDVKRLFANVMSVIITIGLVVMPSIFAWYNIIACWNVFDNTGNLTVAVANVDEGYESDLVPLRVNVGEQVISALRANDQIDWTFTTEQDAIDGARSGRYYAAVVIPESFSRDMLTFYADDAQHASIVYYANEKKSAIAPKITDKGADSVSYQVNEVFAETLSEISLSLAEALVQYADEADIDGRIGDLSEHVRSMADQVDRASEVLVLYASLADTAQGLVSGSSELLSLAQGQMRDVAQAASEGLSGASTTTEALVQSAEALSAALDASSQGFDALASDVDALFDVASKQTQEGASQLRNQATALESQASYYRSLVEQLKKLQGTGSPEFDQALSAAIVRMEAMCELMEDMGASMRDAADALEAGDADVQAQREQVKAQVSEAQAHMSELKRTFDENVVPGMRELAEKMGALAGDVGIGLDKVDEANSDLAGSMGSAGSLMSEASSKISAASQDMASVSGELRALADRIDAALLSGDVEALREVLGSDVHSLSRALAAPVGVERTAVFPAENFGSAMAPLYTTLALFIGSLLILVVVKPTVSEQVRRTCMRDPKPRQLFLGHFGVMAFISLLQTTVMGLGNMLFLQVQVAHPLLFMLCFWGAGLVFTFIIYALVVSFANLGKAFAVLMLIVQVTGCGGSFPLQILPSFIQDLSPYLPATHVVNAMRAAMFGTYGSDFWMEMGCLALFLIPAALLGLVLRKPLARFMNWYVEQVESSKLVG